MIFILKSCFIVWRDPPHSVIKVHALTNDVVLQGQIVIQLAVFASFLFVAAGKVNEFSCLA